MPKPRLLLDWLSLDDATSLPLYRQLYDQLRTAMVSGQLPAGSLLPSSRMLARELKVSRNTIVNAYDQLIAEGYLETSEGSATSVADLSLNRNFGGSRQTGARSTPALSRRGKEI